MTQYAVIPPTGNVCDVLIVGGGIAGLSAAIYSTRERLCTRILEKSIPGGQILTTARVENYPGFPEPSAAWNWPTAWPTRPAASAPTS